MVGGGIYVNPDLVAAPPLFVTTTFPEAALDGTVTVIAVEELTVNVVAATPPIVTVDVP